MKRVLSLLLATALAAPGCASTRALQAGTPAAPGRSAPVEAKVMADYIRQIPVGSRVRVNRSNGTEIRATLMKNDADPLVVQRRARLPEPPIEIPLSDILALELDTPGSSPGRAIAIGAGAAAGATVGVLLLLFALLAD